MKMSWFSINCWERSALQQNIDGQTRRMRGKNRKKRKNTNPLLLQTFTFLLRSVPKKPGKIGSEK